MKRILVINPITTEEFNSSAKEYIDRIKSPDFEVECVNIKKGPASIETFYDEAYALPDILRIVDEYKTKCDAIVINCFADPALNAAREITEIPIVGPAEASMALAILLGHKFAVISTFRNSGPWIEQQARTYGVEDRLAAAVGIDIPVLELKKDLKKTASYLIDAAKELVETKGAEVIVLGCTGMAPVAEMVKKELGIPVVEPMAAALKIAEMLVDLNLKHSKIGLYMEPDKSKITGY
ncbi:MAG: aspartate/glutamate racemase family protein [Thermovenabulum sp.]|uniref:aspartate/glutamate racemase family protein n=1 Tax=Thermovenabulum sp. TaxID=3100335 RepID=UPI003C7E40E0